MGRFSNHLPMAPTALYQMTGDLDRVERCWAYYPNRFGVDPLPSGCPELDNIDACIGHRDLYEPCLDLVNETMASRGAWRGRLNGT